MPKSIIVEIVSHFYPIGEEQTALHDQSLERLAQAVARYAEDRARKMLAGTCDVHMLVESDQK